MRLQRSRRFDRAYAALPPELRKKTEKALRLLVNDFHHPSLHTKKIRGTAGLWEVRVDLYCRLTFELHGDLCILRNVGSHDETIEKP